MSRPVAAPELEVGDPIPAPTGPVVLTVTGRIDATNVGETLQFDLQTLERLGLVEYRADDAQAVGKVVRFRGVLLSAVLDAAGVDADAEVVRATALNDFSAELPIDDAREHEAMIATTVDGERMTVEGYGPIRIVYPNLDYDLPPSSYDERWVWQMRALDVR